MFTCLPSEILDEDEDYLWRVVRARVARNAAWAFNTKGIESSDGQTETYKRMLDALDTRDKRLGIPEEL